MPQISYPYAKGRSLDYSWFLSTWKLQCVSQIYFFLVLFQTVRDTFGGISFNCLEFFLLYIYMYIYTYIFLIRHTVLIGILFYCSILNFNFFPFYFTDTLTFHFLNSFPSSLLVKVLLFSFSLLACSDLRLGFFSCHAFLYVYFELWIALVKTLEPLLCFIVTFFFFHRWVSTLLYFPKMSQIFFHNGKF